MYNKISIDTGSVGCDTLYPHAQCKIIQSKNYLFLTQDIVRLKFRPQVYLNRVYGKLIMAFCAFIRNLLHWGRVNLSFFTKQPPQQQQPKPPHKRSLEI